MAFPEMKKTNKAEPTGQILQTITISGVHLTRCQCTPLTTTTTPTPTPNSVQGSGWVPTLVGTV